MKKVIIKAKNIAPYGKGWQVNAFVDGVETEQTFYGVTKAYAIRQANARIAQYGGLANEPYKEGTIFTQAEREKILAQFEKVVA
jgi:hypothetical protein